jgi:hypothetical protein
MNRKASARCGRTGRTALLRLQTPMEKSPTVCLACTFDPTSLSISMASLNSTFQPKQRGFDARIEPTSWREREATFSSFVLSTRQRLLPSYERRLSQLRILNASGISIRLSWPGERCKKHTLQRSATHLLIGILWSRCNLRLVWSSTEKCLFFVFAATVLPHSI